ncbi:MAG: lipopolysaccharide biosynthesis protein [Bacillota bacterium]
MLKNRNRIVFTSLIWKLLERGATQGIQFIVQIVLARLLYPEDYGIIAIVLVFISVANVFIQSGLNTALIQKKDSDDTDFSSIFYLNLMIAGVLYIILFFTSPLISSFYNEALLTPVLRILSLTLFFGAFNSVQNAYIAKHLLFKKLFFSSLGAILVSASIGISMAYLNYGVWALVIQQLSNTIVISIILFFTVKWRPKLVFAAKRVKVLFSFGWKLLVSSLIDTLYRALTTLIIGKVDTKEMLGYYSKGDQIPALLINSINGSIQSVMLPVLSAEQDNKPRVKQMMRRSIMVSSYAIFPLIVGLIVIAEPLVLLLLTEKWMMTVPFLQILSISYAFYPIHTANLQAINALGRSDVFLKLEITKKIIGITIIFAAIPFGIYALAWSTVISSVISTFINAFPSKKLLNYGYLEQIKDIAPILLLSIIMGALVYLWTLLNLDVMTTILIQVFSGIIIYIFLSVLFKIESLKYLINTIKLILVNKQE